jgi:hypothetical protein
MKRVILSFGLFFICIVGYPQSFDFTEWFKGVRTDTIYENKLVMEIRAFKDEDSIICKKRFDDFGKIKSAELNITYGRYKMFLYHRKYDFDSSGLLIKDSLVDYRNNDNQQIIVKNYYPDSKLWKESISKGKKVKGRGVGETFSWGTTWVTTRKEYNEFGEIIYEEKSTRYHR